MEAETRDEADEMFLSGETIDEEILSDGEVIGRTPHATYLLE